MIIPRVIPILLLRDGGLYKTVKFKEPKYIGDPLNAVKIFNEKEVDELIVLDISATKEGRSPDLETLKEIATECFMPVCYGGGITSLKEVRQIINAGVEKISINSAAFKKPTLVKEISETFGSSTVVVSIDVKRSFFGKYEVCIDGGKINTGVDPITFATKIAANGAGEILINSIDRDGMMAGYDLELIKKITSEVDVPVIACGGAGNLKDFSDAINLSGASAVSAGSMFVFHGKHKAVLINYPSQKEIKQIFNQD